MKKIILNSTMSLDGFVARENGEIDFLDDKLKIETLKGFEKFRNEADVIIMDNITYSKILSEGDYMFTEEKTYVVGVEDKTEGNIVFTNKELALVTEDAKKDSKKNIWLFGGAELITKYLELNLVDEMIITVVPVAIGKGISMFNDITSDKEFKLVSTTSIDGNINMNFIKE